MAREIEWCGHVWDVRPDKQDAGPGPCDWLEKNVRLSNGKLVLQITDEDGWKCAEVMSRETLGYGIYRWVVESDLRDLDPSVVLGLFTYDWQHPDPAVAFNEIDIESSKWSYPTEKNTMQASVHPVGDPQGWNAAFPPIAGPPYGCEIRWYRDHIVFSVTGARGRRIFLKSAPRIRAPRQEKTYMNLWLDRNHAPARGKPIKIVLRNFKHTPF